MINLDDQEKILQLQGGNSVIQSIDNLPKQLKQSLEESLKINYSQDYNQIENVVVCGMGGSRFPSLIIKNLFKDKLKIPYLINDDYSLPEFVNEKTLVILSSYSGTTEEVISCSYQAINKKAKITGLTVGGELKNIFEKYQLPFYLIDPIYNPSEQPRIGFGYFVGGHLGILINLKIININHEEIFQAVDNLEKIIEQFKINISIDNNPIKKLALNLYEKYPYYIVSEFLTGVGNAIANQTNETAKSISTFRVIPELNHHLMEGLKFPDILKELLTFVFFYSNLYSEKIKKRFHITKEVVEQNQIKTLWYELKGKNKIEQTFELMAIGSYLSMYLSVLYEQDPKIIPFVDYFKKRLKE